LEVPLIAIGGDDELDEIWQKRIPQSLRWIALAERATFTPNVGPTTPLIK
jgi:hypothetical protein